MKEVRIEKIAEMIQSNISNPKQAAERIYEYVENEIKQANNLEEEEYYGMEYDPEEDDEPDWEEREEEEAFERACSCTCGAYILTKDLRPLHVADCYCGAD